MKKPGILLVLALVLAGCIAEDAPTSSSVDKIAAGDRGKPMPAFEVPLLAGGTLKSDDLKGKVLIVDFWATWCKPCIEEIPKYNELSAKYDGKAVAFIGMTVQSGSLDDIKPKAAELKIRYPVVLGNDDIEDGFGGIIGWPTTFLISKEGMIVKKYMGSPPGKLEQMAKDIETLLAR